MAAPTKHSAKIASGALVCDEAELLGDVTLGTRSVVHPKARIVAQAGPIVIGEYNIIEEQVEIINSDAQKMRFNEEWLQMEKYKEWLETVPRVNKAWCRLCKMNFVVDNMKNADGTHQTMYIGNNNVFEVGACIESMKVGDHNIVEAKAHVGRNVELSTGCIVGAKCSVDGDEILQENTVIYAENCQRRLQREKPPAQTLQIDFLCKILPNYHYLKKTGKASTPLRT